MYEKLKRLDRLFIFFIVYTLAFVFFFGTLKFTLPFLLAAFFALIITKPTIFIAKILRIKGWIASLITTTIFFISIIIIVFLLTLSLTIESIDITSEITSMISNNSPEITATLRNIDKTLGGLNMSVDSSILTEHLSQIFSSIVDAASIIFQYLFKIIGYVPFIISTSFCTVLATYLFTKNFSDKKLNKKTTKTMPKQIYKVIFELKKLFLDYICGYFLIIGISTALNLVIFSLFGIKYAITLGIVTGILDILPLLGIAIVYIPLIIFYLVQGKTTIGILLTVTFIILCILREILENKIMSSSLGITPLESIICIFSGMQLDGFKGVIFCLFFLVGYKIFLRLDLKIKITQD